MNAVTLQLQSIITSQNEYIQYLHTHIAMQNGKMESLLTDLVQLQESQEQYRHYNSSTRPNDVWNIPVNTGDSISTSNINVNEVNATIHLCEHCIVDIDDLTTIESNDNPDEIPSISDLLRLLQQHSFGEERVSNQ